MRGEYGFRVELHALGRERAVADAHHHVAVGGRALELVRQHGCRVVGLDQSPEMLAGAQARVEAAGLSDRITLVEGGAEQLPFPEGAFDGLTFTYLIRYVEDPGATLAELARVVKPGGIVVVESFASDRSAAQRRPVDIDPADLRRAFAKFELLRFDDGPAVSDWDPQTTRLVRMVAQKPRG